MNPNGGEQSPPNPDTDGFKPYETNLHLQSQEIFVCVCVFIWFFGVAVYCTGVYFTLKWPVGQISEDLHYQGNSAMLQCLSVRLFVILWHHLHSLGNVQFRELLVAFHIQEMEHKFFSQNVWPSAGWFLLWNLTFPLKSENLMTSKHRHVGCQSKGKRLKCWRCVLRF